MQISVALQNSFVFEIILLVILIIFILGMTIYFALKKSKKKQKEEIEIKEVNSKDKKEIQKKYLKDLDKLSKEVEENKVNSREAYQKLSTIIRYFVYEVTNIKVQNYTLKEIKKINMPILYELIQEYYKPEFARQFLGNIKLSIDKTRKVIEKWN